MTFSQELLLLFLLCRLLLLLRSAHHHYHHHARLHTLTCHNFSYLMPFWLLPISLSFLLSSYFIIGSLCLFVIMSIVRRSRLFLDFTTVNICRCHHLCFFFTYIAGCIIIAAAPKNITNSLSSVSIY